LSVYSSQFRRRVWYRGNGGGLRSSKVEEFKGKERKSLTQRARREERRVRREEEPKSTAPSRLRASRNGCATRAGTESFGVEELKSRSMKE
jgi:hypothetical protein